MIGRMDRGLNAAQEVVVLFGGGGSPECGVFFLEFFDLALKNLRWKGLFVFLTCFSQKENLPLLTMCK